MKHISSLTLVFTVLAWGVMARAQELQPRITVSGEAMVKVSPDRVILTFGIETHDLDLERAKAANDRILQAATAAITSCCVSGKDLQTSHLTITPRYENNRRRTPEDFLGYFVSNAFAVVLNEPARLEELMAAALKAGVTNVEDVSFETTDFKTYREQARTLALQAAREKADKMAAVLNSKAGKPLQITEHAGGWWYYSGSRRGGMSQNVVQMVGEAPSELYGSIALGQIGIRASVSVTFALEN